MTSAGPSGSSPTPRPDAAGEADEAPLRGDIEEGAQQDASALPSGQDVDRPGSAVAAAESGPRLQALEASLPAELMFLASAECNPDLTVEKFQVQGNMRSAQRIAAVDHKQMANGCKKIRNRFRVIVYSWVVQTIVYAVILFDLFLILLNFAGAVREGDTVNDVGDWLAVTVLSADVLARFFVEGLSFLRSRMNLFELFLVPVTLVEVFALKQMDLPVPLLRALRPTFRIIRLLRALARTASKGQGYLERLRHSVSGDRIRFTEDGFDLDLAYITAQIVAMSVPAIGRESFLHNPYREVARFLNERHGNKYLLLNTTTERRYSVAPFFSRYVHFPISKDGTPSLDSLMNLCQVLDQFLKADPSHLLAVHSNNGQGRVSIVVLAYLIYSGSYHSVNSAMAFYEHKRVDEENQGTLTTQTLDSASQRRALDYFAHLCISRQRSSVSNVREASIRRVQIVGLPSISNVEVYCYGSAADKPASHNSGRRRSETGAGLRNVFQNEEDSNEDNQDDHGVDPMLIPEAKMMAQVTRILEESSLDSRAAGCAPMQGRPLVSSAPESKANENITFRSREEKDDDMVPGVWDIDKTLVKGELRIEVHRRRHQEQTAQVEKEGTLMSRMSERLCFWRSTKKNQVTRFEGGMLFCFWLHTNYLELDESNDMPSRLRPKNVVTVVLDRWHLDKAANAPSLRSHSAALKLQVDFEVDQRLDLSMSGGDRDDADQFLATDMEFCPPVPLGWLTWVSEKIWPSFQSGFEKLLRDDILPGLQDSLPSPFKNIRLSQFSLGDAFPKFGAITACSQYHDGFEVQLDIDLEYATDANILLEHSMAHFGIDHVALKGVLSLKFRPLLSELPVFSALQLYFQDIPEVTLKFNTPGHITDFPMVSRAISETVDKGLFDLMVLPNIMNINWGDPSNDNSLSFMSVMPTAMVRVEVMEARAIQTSNTFKKLPDVRIEVKLGDQTGNTSVRHNEANPSWGEALDFVVYDERQHLRVGAYDVDFTGRATLLGKGKLSVGSLVAASEDGQEGLWVDISETADKVCGQVRLKASMFQLSGDARKVQAFLPEGCLEATQNAGEEAASPTANSKAPRSRSIFDSVKSSPPADHHSGSVMLLVCDIFGGRLPPEVGLPGEVEVRVTLGDSWGANKCAEAKPVDPGSMGEKTQKIVERLADRGLQADKIADALNQDLADVHRIMRKRGWNLELPQKIPILIYPSDLRSQSAVELAVYANGKCAARADVPLNRLLQAGFQARFSDVMTCMTADAVKVDLDVEFRLFAMVARQYEVETPRAAPVAEGEQADNA